VRRLFTALAFAAMVNVAALGALAAHAYSKGWLEKDRVRRAYAVLTGEEDSTGQQALRNAASQPAPQDRRNRWNDDALNVAMIELDRRKREVQDGWQMLEVQQLALLREKEALEQEKNRRTQEEAARARAAGDGGLKKELEILAGLKPRQARDLLRQKADSDATRILLAMDERKVRKIVGECKTSEERLWIGRILGKLHERDAVQAEVLDAVE